MVIERQNKEACVEIGQAREAVGEFFSQNDYAGKRILMIIPDNTRSGPIGKIFKIIYEFLEPKVKAIDCLVALGTHQPMSEEQICARLSMTPEQIRGGKILQPRMGRAADVHFHRQDLR
jgi:hypothetical protein